MFPSCFVAELMCVSAARRLLCKTKRNPERPFDSELKVFKAIHLDIKNTGQLNLSTKAVNPCYEVTS